MISLSINVTLINKDRLFKGKKGTYLDAVLIETPNSQYADYMIVESVSKEEREQGVKGTILGDAKVIGKKQERQTAPPANPDYKGNDFDKAMDEEPPF